MKLHRRFCVLIAATGAILALGGCQALIQAGSLLSGVEMPGPTLWLKRGDAFEVLDNGQIVETGAGKLGITLKPYPARQKNTLGLYVEAGGQPVEGARVTIQGEMVEMLHVPVSVVGAPQGRGLYSARLELTMKGLWELTIGVERSGTNKADTYIVRLRNDWDPGALGGHAH